MKSINSNINWVDMVNYKIDRLINSRDTATKQHFLLYHCSRYLRESVLMEKSTRNLSSCHVQTRPAYQDLSANVLSYLNQLDPARRRASRRHTLTSYREKEHYVPGPGSKMFSPGTESIVSTQPSAASSTTKFSWTNSSKKMFIVLLCWHGPDLVKPWCG